jgi:oxygen-independent coproporphyrinogen-3 oxidase
METQIPIALVRKYGAPVPRYTSYPTALHFTSRVGELQYISWLDDLADGAQLSLYVHIPYCHELCWYCGCNTKATRRYAPVAQYAQYLETEIANLAVLIPQEHTVTQIHWGGGSPNILAPSDIDSLAEALRGAFKVSRKADFAVEIDPRHLEPDQIAAFCRVGVTRVSVGVQDFDDDVQAAIGRHQSFAATKAAVDAFRHGGVRSVNIDLMYGLPHQTRRSIDRTLRRVLELEPDRIAAFGYAHLPARLKHQRLIDEAALPDVVERYAQSRRIARRLEASDYVRIGLDHFAKPGDPLARGPVHRNFQGYTTDSASALLGIGASAIGRLPQGYVQNAVAAGDYIRRIRDCGLAAARGIELSMDDRVRAYVIERLMCDGTFSRSDIERRFGAAAGPVLADAELLVQSDQGGLVAATADGFRVTEAGRPFVRTICACFDAYMGTEGARYSPGV